MSMLRPALCAGALLLSASPLALAAPVTYDLDAGHTMVLATWNHKGLSNPSAMFSDIEGTLVYDAENPAASTLTVSIPLASVHTSSSKLNEHLQSDDFFNVAKFPVATFKSTKVEQGAAAYMLDVTGDLSFHGVTKPVTLAVTVNKLKLDQESPVAAFDATATLSRSAFDVGLYAPVISDAIELRITTEAHAAKPEAAAKAKG